MSSFCPACRASLPRPGAAFCARCGQSLIGGAAPVSTQLLSGPRLDIQWPGGQPYSVALNQARMRLGRKPDNEIVVNYSTVSEHHAVLQRENTRYRISDMGSSNGLQINGRPAQAELLRDGDVVRVPDGAGNWVTFTYRDGQAAAVPSGTTRLGQIPWASLPSPAFIGRDPGCSLPLSSPVVSWRHAQLTQTPAGHQIKDLNSTNGTFVNGHRVRQHLLRPKDVIQVGPFKLVYDQAGLQQFSSQGRFRLDALNLAQEVPVSGTGVWEKLTRILSNTPSAGPTSKLILNDVSLSIYPREFVAFVGGSGAGKSTLMNALSGVWPARGRVFINGDDFYQNFDAFRSMLGYVPQDDIIHRGLPVKAALRYAAQLRFPNEPVDHLDKQIDQVLASLDLSQQAEQMVSKLSGGQRKRVSIASELMAEPGLFFLDEPTSGLDPGLEKQMMSDLRGLADRGHTIVLVTHATGNIKQCSLVAFMVEGRLAYYGPPDYAPQFFNAQDFAHIYNRLRERVELPCQPSPDLMPTYHRLQAAHPGTKVTIAQVWEAKYRDSPIYQQYVMGRLQQRRAAPAALPAGNSTAKPAGYATGGARTSLWHQFGVLSRRYLHLVFRDTLSLSTLLAVMPLIGLLLVFIAGRMDLLGETPEAIGRIVADEGAYTVVGAAQKLLLMLALAVTLLGVFSGAYEIVKERPVYRRERMINLKLVPYVLSKVVILLGFALLQAAALLFVVSLKVKMPPGGIIFSTTPALELYVTLVLSALAGIALGLLISALVNNQDMVIYVVLLVLFVQIIFSGALFDVPDALSYMTLTRWSLEAMGSTVDMDRLNEMGVKEIPPDELDMPMPPGEPLRVDVRTDFDLGYQHDSGHLLTRWMALLALAMLYVGGTMEVLRRQDVI